MQLFGDTAVNTGYYTLATRRDGAVVQLLARLLRLRQRDGIVDDRRASFIGAALNGAVRDPTDHS